MSRRAISRQTHANRGTRFPNVRGAYNYADDMGRQMDIFGIPRPRGSTTSVPAVTDNAKKPTIRIITDAVIITPKLICAVEIPSETSTVLGAASNTCSELPIAAPSPTTLPATSLDPFPNAGTAYEKESSRENDDHSPPIPVGSLKELLDLLPTDRTVKRLTISMELDNGDKLVVDGKVAL